MEKSYQILNHTYHYSDNSLMIPLLEFYWLRLHSH